MTIQKKLSSTSIKKKLHEYNIKHVWITGSVARGQSHDESDIDIIYEEDAEGMQKSWGYFHIVQYLEEKLGKKIDFIDRHYINKHIKSEILADMKQLW